MIKALFSVKILKKNFSLVLRGSISQTSDHETINTSNGFPWPILRQASYAISTQLFCFLHTLDHPSTYAEQTPKTTKQNKNQGLFCSHCHNSKRYLNNGFLRDRPRSRTPKSTPPIYRLTRSKGGVVCRRAWNINRAGVFRKSFSGYLRAQYPLRDNSLFSFGPFQGPLRGGGKRDALPPITTYYRQVYTHPNRRFWRDRKKDGFIFVSDLPFLLLARKTEASSVS